MKIIEIQNSKRLNSKKTDYVKFAFILLKFGTLSASEINYHYNRIFSGHCNSTRVGMILRSHKNLFCIQDTYSDYRQPKIYSFNGSLILPSSTLRNWNKRINP